ncbi:MAG TPA: TonB-dependent receptor [Steroidobacteraceae bacterium]|nr:TonB-dependent receptor [Steroidobacteraceae bacterium]
MARSSAQGSQALPRRTQVSIAVATALAGAALPCTLARAAAAADAAATPGGLQEVVVTARKREENLQDVPISMDVFTSKDMQNLGITSLDDYVQKDPSLSFVSVGPGTQVVVMRGASDGSSPNYSNTSAVGFFFEDSSLSWGSVQPDLHLYDMERIEVLSGPQGTTFGAGSMTGAVRYITNKPDVNSVSAGVDFNAGQIQNGQQNWTYEGFFNVPIIEGVLGFRASGFSDSHGGFIDNQLTTRTWVNGTVSNNAPWARNDYNRSHNEGGRAALKYVLNDKWSGTLIYDYQRLSTLGAWDEDPTLQPRTVERFGPESHDFQSKIVNLHVDGDIGIADLVFASTYWSIPTRQQNEYSQYMQNFNWGAPDAGFPGTQEGLTCLNDPYFGGGPYSGCNVPTQSYEYHTNPERWSDELRLLSKTGGRLHWLVGAYWEKTRDKNSGSTYYIPGLRTNGKAYEHFNYYYNAYAYTNPTTSLPAGTWYAYTTRSDYLQTTEFININFDLTDKLNVEAGTVHFHSDATYYSPYGQFTYAPTTPALSQNTSHKWDSRFGVNYKFTDKVLGYALFSQGFRDGGANSGYPQSCYDSGVPHSYTPDTIDNYELGWKSTSLQGRLIWNGALYDMEWKQFQTIIYDPLVCAPSSYYVNVGDARIYGGETNADYKINDNWSVQAAATYDDARIISSPYAVFQQEVNERLPFSPYFSWSWNVRYEAPLKANLKGYAQFDMTHKGDMWNDLSPDSTFTGLPRVLQPGYTLMNVRFGLNPAGGHWLAELYVTNLTDKNAIIYSNTGNYDLRLTTNEPRVYGLRVNYRFGKEVNTE